MRIVLGADHAGFELKDKIKQHLSAQGMEVEDEGTHSGESVDYPDFARKVGEKVLKGEGAYGVLVCGTGIGMAISANKIHGVRAANCHTVMEAQLSREHNDANILTLGARVLDSPQALEIVDAWLKAQFAGNGRHLRRVEKIQELEHQERVS